MKITKEMIDHPLNNKKDKKIQNKIKKVLTSFSLLYIIVDMETEVNLTKTQKEMIKSANNRNHHLEKLRFEGEYVTGFSFSKGIRIRLNAMDLIREGEEIASTEKKAVAI
jgi:hypothetical protein